MGVLPTIRPPGLAGGGGAWAPTDEASLEGWWDASDTSTITNSGDDVSQIDDKSGNILHLTEGTAANQPHTGTRTMNSLNVLDFNGSSHRLSCSVTWSNYTDLMFLGVVHVDDPDGGHSIMRAGNTSRFDFWSVNPTGWLPYCQLFGSGNTSLSYGTAVDGQDVQFAIELDQTSDENALYTDGTSRDSNTTPAYQAAINSTIFDVMHNTGSQFTDGALAELMFFSAVSDTIRQKAEGYLAHKWGIESALPAGHPYKSSPP